MTEIRETQKDIKTAQKPDAQKTDVVPQTPPIKDRQEPTLPQSNKTQPKKSPFLVSSDGGGKVEMTPAQADNQANSAFKAAQSRIAGIPGATVELVEVDGGTREVRVFVPDAYKKEYESRK